MDKYVNEATIIKNAQYESFKDFIYCKNCELLMIEPFMCMNCQKKCCKECAENWKKNKNCPCNCKKPKFKKVIEENNFLSKMKFKCIKGCEEEISFDDINKHYKSNCNKKKKNSNEKQKVDTKDEKKKIEILTPEEVKKKTDNGEEIKRMASKIYLFNFVLVIALGDALVGKTSLITT
jgi:hypothetical protein